MGTRLTIQPSTLKRRLSLFKACCFLTTRLGFFPDRDILHLPPERTIPTRQRFGRKGPGGRPPYQAAFIV